MLNRLTLATAILVFGIPPLATLADDDGKPVAAAKAQAADGDKKPSAKKDVSAASAEPLKETLQKALKQIKALDDEAAKIRPGVSSAVAGHDGDEIAEGLGSRCDASDWPCPGEDREPRGPARSHVADCTAMSRGPFLKPSPP